MASTLTALQQLDTDMRLVGEFLRNADNPPKLQDAQCDNLTKRIGDMTLRPEDASGLLLAIAAGPWHRPHRDALTEAVSSSMTTSMAAKAPARRRANQDMMFLEHYLSVSEVATMVDASVNIMTKTQLVADRLLLVGCDIPNEQSMRHIVATIVMLGAPHVQHDSQNMFTMLGELKRILKKRRLPRDATSALNVDVFPSDPTTLTNYAQVYAEGDPCCNTALPGIRIVANAIPLRKSNCAVKVGPPTSAQQMHAFMQHFLQLSGGQTPGSMDIPMTYSPLSTTPRAPLCLEAPQPAAALSPPPPLCLEAPRPAAQFGARQDLRVRDQELFHSPRSFRETALTRGEINAASQHAELSAEDQSAMVGNALDDREAEKAAAKAAKLKEDADAKAAAKAKEDADAKAANAPAAKTKAKAKSKAKAKVKATAKVKEPYNAKVKAASKVQAHATVRPSVTTKRKASDNIPQTLIKKFKTGCAKCRNRPGCTPSCWMKRGFNV
jgi:hypothetical protein